MSPTESPTPNPTQIPTQSPTGSPTTPTPTTDPFGVLGDFEYLYVNTNERFEDAKIACQNWGGDVVSIHSNTENTFVWNLAGAGRVDYWLGAFKFSVGGDYIWVDRTSFDYNNFETQEPNDPGKRCLTTFNKSETWEDVNCGVNSIRPYVCKRPVPVPTQSPTEAPTIVVTLAPTPIPTESPTLTPTLNPTLSPGLSSGIFSGFEYLFVNIDKRYSSAVSFCHNLDGHVVSIHSSEENTFVWELAGSGETDYWLGAVKNSVGGPYEWTDETVFDYTNFLVGEPNEPGRRCLTTFSGTEKWQDVNCGLSFVRPFVCKKEIA